VGHPVLEIIIKVFLIRNQFMILFNLNIFLDFAIAKNIG